MKIGAVAFGVLLFKSLAALALTNSVVADEPIYDAVVTIKTQGIDEEGLAVPGYCNGTILSEKIILTAAHCLVQSEILNKKVIEIQIGKYKYAQNSSGKRFLVGYGPRYTQIEMNPDFLFQKSLWKKIKAKDLGAVIMPYEDMALIRLRAALPLNEYGIKPVKVAAPSQLQGQLEPMVVSVNYLAEVNSSNVRRKAVLDRFSIVQNIEGYHLKSESGSRVEPLDSGSPVFIKSKDQLYLVALTKGRATLDGTNWDVFPILVYSLQTLYFN